MKTVQITLLLPGIAVLPSAHSQEMTRELPPLPALSGLLGRMRRVKRSAADFESFVGEVFGLKERLPVAALTYWFDKGRPPVKPVLRADPVYLKVDRDCVLMLGRHSLQVSRAEAEQLTAQIDRLYADESWALEIGTAERWYIASEQEFNITTCPVTDAFGKNIASYLPKGDAQKKWRAVLNEVQMLLHTSEVNQERESHGRLPINSLWLWGEGNLPSRGANATPMFDKVWTNEALGRGLALWAQCAHGDLPGSANEWLKQLTGGAYLLVFDDLRTLAREDFHSWGHTLTQWDENWFAPLRKAAHGIQVRVETCNGWGFESTGFLQRKWFGQNRPWFERL